MFNAVTILSDTIHQGLKELYSITAGEILLQKTRKEFEGDFTLVTFPYIKEARKSPELLGEALGKYLRENNGRVAGFNVVKGFLNISLSDEFWISYFNSVAVNGFTAQDLKKSGRTIMLEYSSPNTNKPL